MGSSADVEHVKAPRRLASDAGAVTVEAAFAIAALVVVLALCAAGITAVSTQVRCIDAAREAARLVARGDPDSASTAARRIAPGDAVVSWRREGPFVVARVSADTALLLGLTISAEAVSAAELNSR